MSKQYIVYTYNLQNMTETDHEKEYKQSNRALAEWFLANTDNPPTTATNFEERHAELFITVWIRELSEISSLSKTIY